jgi:hypothetical protein
MRIMIINNDARIADEFVFYTDADRVELWKIPVEVTTKSDIPELEPTEPTIPGAEPTNCIGATTP